MYSDSHHQVGQVDSNVSKVEGSNMWMFSLSLTFVEREYLFSKE